MDNFNELIHEVTNTKLNIYEAYDNGYITESEKDSLIEILEAETGNDKEATKKKIKKAIKICTLLLAVIAIVGVGAIAVNYKISEDSYKENKRNSAYHHNSVIVRNLKKYKDEIIDIESDLKALEKKISNSTNYGLTAKGHEDVDTAVNKVKSIYKAASNEFYKLDNNDVSGELSKANHIMSEIESLFNTL